MDCPVEGHIKLKLKSPASRKKRGLIKRALLRAAGGKVLITYSIITCTFDFYRYKSNEFSVRETPMAPNMAPFENGENA